MRLLFIQGTDVAGLVRRANGELCMMLLNRVEAGNFMELLKEMSSARMENDLLVYESQGT